MNISRRDCLRSWAAAGAWASRAAAAPAAAPVLEFPGASSPSIARVVYGKPFDGEPRGPFGTDQSHPALRRGKSLAALTNVEVVTAPFTVPEQALRLNVDVRHGIAALTCGAYAMVAVLDESGQVIKGYEPEPSLAADVDALDYLLLWGKLTTAALAGRSVSLQLYLRDARLYSVHTLEAPPKPLERLHLEAGRRSLAVWDNTWFSLRGEAADGSVVSLHHESIALPASAPGRLAARVDKRYEHRGRITLMPGSGPATLRAEVMRGNRRIVSNEIAIDASPRADRAAAPGFTMIFPRAADIDQVSGSVRFQPNTVEYYAETEGLPTTSRAMAVFNRRVGDRYHVWGSSRTPAGRIYRAVTADGVHYSQEPVQTDMNPQNFMDMTYSPARDEYLAFERAFGPSRWYVHKSRDGVRFERAGLAFQDFDGLESAWDSANSQYVAFQLTLQSLPAPRRYADNLGSVVRLLGNRGRRIFSRRTSPDGVHWTPADNVDLANPATWLDARYNAIAPDAGDPPDLECYWLNVFPYAGLYFGLIMWYAAAPAGFLDRYPYDDYPSKHGPHVSTEWLVSSDLKRWERPFRGFPATRDLRLYFTHAPMVLHDRLLFLVSNQNFNYPHYHGARPGQNLEVYGLPLDRIVSAGGGAGASFSTRPFRMPEAPLHLNAEGDLAVELVDEAGRTVPGYERTACALSRMDAMHHRLSWSGRPTSALAGRTLRVRFHLGGARVYSLHAVAG
jgi:hypothetical protein